MDASMPVSRSPLRLLLLLAIGAPAEAWSAFHGRSAMRARGEPAVTGLSHYSTPLLRQRTHEPLMAEKPSVPSVSKAALVDAIALKAGVSKKTAALVLGATLDVIVDSVCDNNKVSLVGFGTFSAKERPEREARNPKTGEKMIVKAATVPAFSFGKSFKDAVKARGTGGSAQQ